MEYHNQFQTSEEIINTLLMTKHASEARDELIKRFMPFIIKCVSEFTGKYVQFGDSDELSIGLMAFNEAIDRYDAQKGLFLPYAKLVISSRLKSYFEKERRKAIPLAIEDIESHQSTEILNSFQSSNGLEEEILIWKSELQKFKITFQDLLDKKPKHKDTLSNTMMISKQVSERKTLTAIMFEKYRLPISKIHRELKTSIKVLEKNKVFITSVVIIFVKELGAIKRWITRD